MVLLRVVTAREQRLLRVCLKVPSGKMWYFDFPATWSSSCAFLELRYSRSVGLVLDLCKTGAVALDVQTGKNCDNQCGWVVLLFLAFFV